MRSYERTHDIVRALAGTRSDGAELELAAEGPVLWALSLGEVAVVAPADRMRAFRVQEPGDVSGDLGHPGPPPPRAWPTSGVTTTSDEAEHMVEQQDAADTRVQTPGAERRGHEEDQVQSRGQWQRGQPQRRHQTLGAGEGGHGEGKLLYRARPATIAPRIRNKALHCHWNS